MSKDFEKSMEELEKVVNKLEEGTLSLDASIEEFERGMKLVKECRAKLSDARRKITRITENGEESDFEVTDSEG